MPQYNRRNTTLKDLKNLIFPKHTYKYGLEWVSEGNEGTGSLSEGVAGALIIFKHMVLNQ